MVIGEIQVIELELKGRGTGGKVALVMGVVSSSPSLT